MWGMQVVSEKTGKKKKNGCISWNVKLFSKELCNR